MSDVVGRIQRGATGENAVEIRTGVCIDLVRLRWRRFACSDESNSERQQYNGGHVHYRCDGQVGFDDAESESDACCEVDVAPGVISVLLAILLNAHILATQWTYALVLERIHADAGFASLLVARLRLRSLCYSFQFTNRERLVRRRTDRPRDSRKRARLSLLHRSSEPK